MHARVHIERAFDTPSSPQARGRRLIVLSASTPPLLRRPSIPSPRLGKFCRPLWIETGDAIREHFLSSAPKPRHRSWRDPNDERDKPTDPADFSMFSSRHESHGDDLLTRELETRQVCPRPRYLRLDREFSVAS